MGGFITKSKVMKNNDGVSPNSYESFIQTTLSFDELFRFEKLA